MFQDNDLPVQLDSSLFEKFFSEMAGENFVSIGDDGRWHAMQLVDLLHECRSYCDCGERMRQGHKVGVL